MGIEIFPRKNKPSTFKTALLELNTSTIQEISKKYGICSKILENSKTLTKSELKNLQIKLAIEEYIQTDGFNRSINKISNKYGINRKTLVKYLSENDIQITRKNDFANCYETAFDSIDTEEKVY